MKKPNFFIVGAPKCGTTALASYLSNHPQVFITNPKEPRYFSDEARISKFDTFEKYIALFEEASDNHLAVGEGSVCYIYSETAICNIWKYDSNSKIIVMLRNPVDLVYSFHSQLVYNQGENIEDFKEAWMLQEPRSQGKYIPPLATNPEVFQYRYIGSLGTQVERVLNVFPHDQIKFILFDDFKNDPEAIYQETLRFLGIEQSYKITFEKVNVNKKSKNRILARLTEKPPYYLVEFSRKVKEILGISSFGFVNMVRRLNTKQVERQSLDANFRKLLVAEFYDEVDKLSTLIDRDLSHWKR